MYTPHSLEIALLMMITSAICWGSWANTFKGVKNYRFELFYWDYALGIFLISLILAFTMGSTSASDPASFLNNVHSADGSNIVYMLIAGAIFNLANLLLVAGIDMAGLAVAFPVSIGIALVVGVVSSYALQPKGNLGLLAAGVACAVVAVILDGKGLRQSGQRGAFGFQEKHRYLHCLRRSDGTVGALRDSRHDARKSARALQRGRFPDPGRAALLLDLECLLHEETAGGRAGQLQRLLQRAAFRTRSRPARRIYLGPGHGLQSGRRKFYRVAISYAIGQSAPMVAALWGVLAWKEFKGSGSQAKMYLVFMFVFYALAILLVAHANG